MKDMWVLRLKDEYKEEGMTGEYYHDDSERGEQADFMWLTQDLNEATLYNKEEQIYWMKEYEKVTFEKHGPNAFCAAGYTYMMEHFDFVEVEVSEVR